MKKGMAFAVRILLTVVAVLITVLVTKQIHDHPEFLTKGKTEDLYTILDAGAGYPEGKFVSIDGAVVLSHFATMNYSLDGVPTTKDGYYYVILKNRDAIVVKAGATSDIEVLQTASDSPLKSLLEQLLTDNGTIHLEGKLVKLTDQRIVEFYQERSADYGFSDSALSLVKPQLYELDMTAWHMENVLRYIGLPALGLLVLVGIAVIISKKRKHA